MKGRILTLVMLGLTSMGGATSQAASRTASICKAALTQALDSGSAGKDSLALEDFLSGADCKAELLLSSSNEVKVELADRVKFVAAALQQNGSTAGSGGGTDLTSKGLAAKTLSVAAEYGGLTQSVNGQTITLSGSLGGIPTALIKHGIVDDCDGVQIPGVPCVSNGTINKLNRLSYSVAFNTGASSQSVSGTASSSSGSTSTSNSSSSSTSTAQPTVFTAAGNTISSATGKFVLLPGASASIADTVKAINSLGSKSFATLTTAQKGFLTKFEADSGMLTGAGATADQIAVSDRLKQWQNKTAQLVLAADGTSRTAGKSGEQPLEVWAGQADALMEAICPAASAGATACRANLLKEASDYALAVGGYKAAVAGYVESLRKAPLLTFEYDFNRPASQPTNSTFRLIGQTIQGGWTLTFNAAASIYNSTPSSAIPGSSLLRDIQAAAESSYDFSKVKKNTLLGNSTASATYYFQDQTSPAILNVTPGQPVSGITITGLPSNATQVFAQKGKINIVQGKFTYSPGSSAITFPVSVTWSNRTELITNSVWQGQLGISYNFDSLFGSQK